jgi:hypothetical protein
LRKATCRPKRVDWEARQRQHAQECEKGAEVSKKTTFLALIAITIGLFVGISLGGPKFVSAVQMQFGSKGKIELIERCIEMLGCAIGPDDLDFQDRYYAVRESELGKRVKESDAVEGLVEE